VSIAEALAVLTAGVAAGTINTIVGSGSLITFPTLLAVGLPPIVANVSNTVGLVPGGVSGVIGYRRELIGQRGRLIRYGLAAAAGGLTGGLLLLALPARVFALAVPVLILLACILVAIQPWLSRMLVRHHGDGAERSPLVSAAVYATGIYGGYFGAAQGVLLFALLSVLVDDDPQRLNGLKNALVLTVNFVAAGLFLVAAPVAWPAAALVAAGSIIGGQLGAIIGRRLPAVILRSAIVIVGGLVAVRLLVSG
jgi:uncharacterized membrane protein YfcA